MSPRNFDEDFSSDEAADIGKAFASAIAALNEMGKDGQVCARRLRTSEESFAAEGPVLAKREAFRAFHLGLKRKEEIGVENSDPLPMWSANAGLKLAYEIGGEAARLNHKIRARGLFRRQKMAPLDSKDVRGIFERGMMAVATSGKRMADNR